MITTAASGRVCALCGSSASTVVYDLAAKQAPARVVPSHKPYTISDSELEKPSSVVRCGGCGLVRAEPFPANDSLMGDYQTMEDPVYLQEESGRREQARVILRRIKAFKKQGRLLDIGCGPGLLLDEARKMGWDVQGVELSAWGRRYGREKLGLDIVDGPFESAPLEPNGFDVIVMLDVIEHLEDPAAALKKIERLLKPGGVLYLSTPDFDSALSRLLKGSWWGIQRHHLYYFSEATLRAVFERLDLRVLKRMRYPRIFSWSYWAKRIRSHAGAVAAPLVWLSDKGFLRGKNLSLTLRDQIDVIVSKPTTVENVTVRETKAFTRPAVKGSVFVVLPAYNAARTLARTVADIPKDCVDQIVLVDDCSRDNTVEIARGLGLTTVAHPKNLGYGGNQKTCYKTALEAGADIIVMVHPDYQYDPRIIPQLIEPIRQGRADAVFGSRMMKGGALEGGMPKWKHNANILLTALENVVLGTYLTEYHSGFRAYSARMLKAIPFEKNSDDFVFDTEIIVQLLANHYRIEEVPIQTRYFEGASMIGFWRSVRYGLAILAVMVRYCLHDRSIWKSRQFSPRETVG